MLNYKKNHLKYALLAVLIISTFIFFPLLAQEKITKELNEKKGKDRIPLLLELTKAYRRDNPQKSIDYGKEALYLLIKYPNKKIRAQILNHMSNAYRFLGEFKTAKEHAEVSLKFVKEIGDRKGQAQAMYSLGIINFELGEFDQAITYYLNSSKIFYELKDFKNQAMALNSIGGTYKELGEFPTALDYHLKGLEIFENIQDQWGISVITSNIAMVYKELKEFDTSLEYFRKALEIFKSRNDQVSLASTLISIAEIYRLKQNYDEALLNSKKALKISEEKSVKILTCDILKEIGEIKKELKKYEEALIYFNRSLSLRRELNEKIGISDVLINIASIYREMGQYDEAILKAKEALEIAKSVNIKARLSTAYLELSKISEARKDYKKAFDYFKKYKEINDSIFNEDTTRKITSLQNNFDLQKKQKEIEILKIEGLNQRIMLIFLILFAVLILMLAFVIFTRYRLKSKAAQALRNEIKVREKTEIKLRESEEKFRILAEKSVVGIWIIQDSLIKYVNPRSAKIFALSQNEMIGKDPLDLVINEDRHTVLVNMDKRMNGTANALSYEFKGITGEGDNINLESYGSVTIYDGAPALLESIIDITRRKKAESELLKSSKMEAIGILAGGIAHDFNNLLAVIVGNTSMLKLSFGEENPKMNQYLDNVERASHQAADLAQKFITFSEGGWVMRKKLKLMDVLKDTAQLSPIVKEISYDLSIPQELYYIYGDERQLRQVMTNLLINAHEATINQYQGEISVSAQNIYLDKENTFSLKKGEYVKVSVADNGKGIPGELLEKIFDPYFSTKNSFNQKGLGMGLPICYSIIKKHEGHININSIIHKGTTVEVFLPVFND